jgi:hypothetical protein
METPPKRQRPQRVELAAGHDLFDIFDAEVRLPFVIGVMADFSGSPAQPRPTVANRRIRLVDIGNLDDLMKRLGTRVAFRVPRPGGAGGDLAVDLTFERMDDFAPAAIARRLGLGDAAGRGAVHGILDAVLHHPDLQRGDGSGRERGLTEASRGVRRLRG